MDEGSRHPRRLTVVTFFNPEHMQTYEYPERTLAVLQCPLCPRLSTNPRQWWFDSEIQANALMVRWEVFEDVSVETLGDHAPGNGDAWWKIGCLNNHVLRTAGDEGWDGQDSALPPSKWSWASIMARFGSLDVAYVEWLNEPSDDDMLSAEEYADKYEHVLEDIETVLPPVEEQA